MVQNCRCLLKASPYPQTRTPPQHKDQNSKIEDVENIQVKTDLPVISDLVIFWIRDQFFFKIN